MKTAISIPDSTYAAVEKKAHELGWSRSEFYAKAAECMLGQLEEGSLVNSINAAIESAGDRDESNMAAVTAGRRTLARETW